MKIKESVGRLAVVLLFFVNLFVVFYIWFISSGSLLLEGTSDVILSLGRIFGLLAVYFVLIQLILIGRIMWIERLFGHDKLSHIHHLNGFLALVFIILHPFLIIWAYGIINGVSFISQLSSFVISNNALLHALIAIVLFSIVVALSFELIRKKLKYEYWYFVHLCIYVAIILAFGHQLKLGGDLQSRFASFYWYAIYGFVIANFILFRFLAPLYLFNKFRFKVEKIVRENKNTVSIYISGKRMNKFIIESGQFMIFRFMQKGFWYEAHPFSLSGMEKGKLRITIKDVGDFSSKIDKLKVGSYVIIDGPYGRFTENSEVCEKKLFIAGGIGITPIKSLAEKCVKNEKDCVLLYSAKSKEDIVFKKELDALAKMKGFKGYYILSEQKSSGMLYGRVDTSLIRQLVPDFKNRDAFICGPQAMNKGISKILREMGVSKNQIHYEKFSLG